MCDKVSPIVFCFNFLPTELDRRGANTNFSIIDQKATNENVTAISSFN